MLHARRIKSARPCKVLVVDESYLSRRQIQARLGESHVRLYHCSRAEEAVGIAAECAPDYILIDYALFGTNPVALQRQLASEGRTARIPVLFIVDERDDLAVRLGDCITLEDNGLERLLGLA